MEVSKDTCMKTSQLTEDMLGPHNPLLPINAIQQMVFTSPDSGPFYMDPMEKELLNNDDLVGEKFTMMDRKS